MVHCCLCISTESVNFTDPGVADFGSVVVGSTAEITLTIKNYTSSHISIKLKVSVSTCNSPVSL